MKFKSILLRSNAILKDAIRLLENSDKGIVLVVDEINTLLGTITDGDIRRSLLTGLNLEVQVKEVMTKNMIVLDENEEHLQNKAEILMIKNDIRQIPIIDNENKVVDLITFKDIHKSVPQKLPMVVIMAGGLGSRLLPLTQNIPKPMLKLGQKPMLEIVLNNCIKVGLKDFYFAVNHLKDQIIDYFGNGSKWGVAIKYLQEDRPLGTAGALKLLDVEEDRPILVLNGDVLTTLNIANLINFHYKYSSLATICVREHVEKLAYGVVHLSNEKVKSIEEKPSFSSYVNAGIYLLEPNILEFIQEEKPIDMPELLNLVLEKNMNVSACPIHEYWLDVGQPETFSKAKEYWDSKLSKKYK